MSDFNKEPTLYINDSELDMTTFVVGNKEWISLIIV